MAGTCHINPRTGAAGAIGTRDRPFGQGWFDSVRVNREAFMPLLLETEEPEGVVPATPGQIGQAPTGTIWAKKTGTGSSGWGQLATFPYTVDYRGVAYPSEVDGGTFSELNPIITASHTPRVIVPGTVEEVVDGDRVNSRNTSATTVNDYQCFLELGVDGIYDVVWETSDPSIATVSQDGFVTYVSTGRVTIYARVDELNVRVPIEFHMLTYTTVTDTFLRFIETSLAYASSLAVDQRIAGTDRNVARHIYLSFPSNSNYTDPTETRGAVDEFIRNPEFWAVRSGIPGHPPLDLSCISPSHVKAGETLHRRSPTATAISPIHWVSCTHSSFHPPLGSRLYFVHMDGTLTFRTTVAKSAVPNTDFTIGILDSPLPAGVVPAKVLPNNADTHVTYFNNIPGLLLDQQEHGMVHDLSHESSWKYPTDAKRYEYVDTIEDNRVWSQPGIELYDSGNPSFLIINDELVLMTVWTGGGGGGGSNLRLNKAAIQSTMNNLSNANAKPLYTLAEADLSSFTP